MSFSGGYGEAKDEDSLKVLSKAIELGCTFWDTAQVYGQGHNEELIGRFLRETPGAREKVFIGSKCGFTVSPIHFSTLSSESNRDREPLLISSERL
jgi:aryl-alcohol dehydrogenase-like predicted oxidoreductase